MKVDTWDINLADRGRLQKAIEAAEKAALKAFVESDFVEHRRLYMLAHPAPAPAPAAPVFGPPPPIVKEEEEEEEECSSPLPPLKKSKN